MLCTKCGKNEATVYFSRTVNGNKTEQRLCADCAKETGVTDSFIKHRNYVHNSLFAPMGAMRTFFETPALTLFDSFFDHDFFPELQVLSAPETESTTIGEKPAPEEPVAETPENKLSGLRAKLQAAVKEERYEDAAKYRDEIKALEK